MRTKEIIEKNKSLFHNKKIILLLISAYTLFFFGTFIGTLHAQTNIHGPVYMYAPKIQLDQNIKERMYI